MAKKQKDVQKAIAEVRGWDFNPSDDEKVLYIEPVPIIPKGGDNTRYLDEIKPKLKKIKGLDLLEQNNIPIYDKEQNILLCGNKNVAVMLIAQGHQLLLQRVKYPVMDIRA